MQRSLYLFFVGLICFFLFASQADAFQCVNGTGGGLAADFQAALGNVSATDYEIRLIAGTYTIPANSAGHFNVSIDHSLTISGGWPAGCTDGTQVIDSTRTVLQGGNTLAEATTQMGHQGGVLFVKISNTSLATVEISNLTIQNGSSNLSGGGLYFEYSDTASAATNLKISNLIAQSNSAGTYGSGIAIFSWVINHALTVDIQNSLVKNNTVGSGGGPAGIHIDCKNLELSISNCQITNNASETDGGGLYISSESGNTTLVNNIIARNTVLELYGAGILIDNSPTSGTTTLTNNTISENINSGTSGESLKGSELYVYLDTEDSSLNLYNNIFYNTKNGDASDKDISIENPLSNPVTVQYNDLNYARFDIQYDAPPDGTNLNNSDPLFVSASNDYHLTASSPTRDTGNNDAPALPETDIDGMTRIQNNIVDMGAYEYQAPATLPSGDINNDTEVNLADVIAGLQILTGKETGTVSSAGDVNQDGKIGIEDVIYILQVISGLKP